MTTWSLYSIFLTVAVLSSHAAAKTVCPSAALLASSSSLTVSAPGWSCATPTNLPVSGSVTITINSAAKFTNVRFHVLAGASLTFTGGNCQFTDTVVSAAFISTNGGRGGAVFLVDALGSVTFDCTTFFKGNSLPYNIAGKSPLIEPPILSFSGGAIYNQGVLKFNKGTTFENNSCVGPSGWPIADMTSLVLQTEFTGAPIRSAARGPPYQGQNGGAILNTGTITFSSDVKFENNSGVFGGAIRNNAGSITYESTAKFTSNNACQGGAYRSRAGMTFKGAVIFEENETIGDQSLGGASSDDGTSTFYSTVKYTGNKSGRGGAIYRALGSATYKQGVSFEDNSAISDPYTVERYSNYASGRIGDGGAVFLSDGRLTFESTATFENNFCDGTGGGAALAASAILDLQGESTFINNSGPVNGGAIGYFGYPGTTSGSVVFGGHAAFENNSAVKVDTEGAGWLSTEGIGGAIGLVSLYDGSTTCAASFLSSAYFKGNKAQREGGAVFDDGSFTFADPSAITFEDNEVIDTDASNDVSTCQSEDPEFSGLDAIVETATIPETCAPVPGRGRSLPDVEGSGIIPW